MNYDKTITSSYPGIAVNTNNGIIFLNEMEILYCKAEGSYTHIYLQGTIKNKITVSKSLSRVLESLQIDYFVRIHNSFAINLLHLISFSNRNKNCVLMSDGEHLAVSRARKESLMKRFRMI